MIEQNLSVNNEAGFKAVKRDKSVNKRAGLHDKKKNLEGDSRILRRRPLTLRRKRIARKVAAVLSVVFVGAVSYVGVGFLIKDNTPIDDPGYATVRYAAPTNGSLPTDHTDVENIAYINYVLHNQPYWSSSMTSTVHTVMEQTVKTFKHYYNGILISEDVEKGVSNKLTQFCVPEDVALWRDETGINRGVDAEWAKKSVLWRGGSGDYQGTKTKWSTAPASGSVITDYRKERGLPVSEFSVYILNELTIKNASETSVIDNGDGTYSLTVELNVNPEGETSAVHYYKQQMKIKGGLSKYPVYYFTNINFVFDADWRVLSFDISDGYQAAIGGLAPNCTSETHTVFNYGDEQTVKETVTGYYNNYFVKYKDKFTPDVVGEPELDAATLLANAFSGVISDGATFKVNLGLDGQTTQGFAYVGMEGGALSDLRLALGKDISVYLAQENEKQYVYLKAGANAKIKLCLDDLTSSGASDNEESSESSESGTGGFSLDGLLEQLFGGELTVGETKASLKSTLNLFGVKAQLDFYFDIDGETISLDNISAGLIVGGSKVDAKLRFASETEKPAELTAKEKSAYQDVLKNGLSISGKLDIRVGGTAVNFLVEKFALSLNGGLSFAVKAQIVAGGIYNDIYASFKSGRLKFVYGGACAIKTIEETVDGDGNFGGGSVGAVLDIEGNDLETLKQALLSLYNRVAGVVNTMLENGDLKTAESFDDVLNLLSNGANAASALDSVLKLIGVPAGEDGKYSVESIMSGIRLYANGSEVGVKLGTLGLEFGFGEDGEIKLGVALNISGKNVSVKLSDFTVSAYESVEQPVSDESLLTASDFAEMLDYVGAAAELLTENNVTATVNGNVDLDEGNGYAFDAELQYSAGANGFPVHINAGKTNENGVRENVDFRIDSTMYAHFNLSLVSKSSANDSMYLDVYILDANPASTADGKTSGGYTADNSLDVYVSLSKYKETEANYNPLKLYMPVEDILTIASMGVSMLNIGGLEFEGENAEQLNGIVAEISNVLNQLLISKYLGAEEDKYISLGDSIINQILSSLGSNAKNLQELLSSVIDGLFADGETEEPEEKEVVEGNYIKSVNFDGGLNIVLNSASVYGNANDDLKISVTKTGSGVGSRITGVTLDNVYFGENNSNSLNLALGLNYAEVKKPETLDGFKNFGNIDTLIKAFVNSATHKTTEKEYNAGVKTAYSLNSNFLIAGGITLSVPLVGSIPVAIEGFSVNIDNNNKVNFHIRIGLQPKWGIIDGETYDDLTIMDDMIYIKRTLKSKYNGLSLKACNEVEYRIMPLSEFTANIMENITFMFNVGGTLAEQLNKINTSNTNKEELVFNDFGDYISNFISLYDYNSQTNEWTVNINSDTISKISGITLKDLSVKLGAEVADEQLLIKKLSVGGSLFGAIGVSGDLTYCNPQYDGSDNYDWKPVEITVESKQFTVKGDRTVDLANDAGQGVDGYSWSQLLGGTKFEDICKHVNWSEIVADTGKKHLAYNPANSMLGVTDVNFEKEVIGGGFVGFGERATVLYNTSNGKIYTYYVKPELSEMPELNGVSCEWENAYRVEGNSFVYRAVYNVSYVQSEYAVDGSYVRNETAQIYIKTFEKGAVGEKIYLPKDVTVEKDGYVYGLNRYIDAMNGGASLNLATYTDADGKEWFVINADEKFVLTAVWERLYRVAFSSDAGDTVKYFYEGDVITADDMPAIPEKEGYYGVWANEQIANANGFKVVANNAGYTFTVKYGAMVKVNIISNIALNGINGYGFDGTKYYNNYIENTSATLPDISGYASDKTYYFEGFYQNADFTGARYESGYGFDVAQDVTYYANWVSKTISLIYSSDIEMTLSGETATTFTYNAVGGALAGCTPNTDGLIYLGWFVKGDDGKYVHVTSVDGIRSACRAQVESAETNADIKVWAVWVTEVNVNIDTASKSFGTWTIGGTYTGGDYASEMSRVVAESAGVTRTVQVRYELNDKVEHTDGSQVKDKLKSGKWIDVSNNSFKESGMTTLIGASYGGARIKVTFECSGGLSVSVEKSAFKKK